MRLKGSFTLIAFFIFSMFISIARIEVGHTNDRNDGMVEQAAVINPQSSSNQLTAQDKSDAGHAYALTFAHYEPLLLLLFGSILLSSGTVIRFMHSKRLRAKSLPAVTGDNQAV